MQKREHKEQTVLTKFKKNSFMQTKAVLNYVDVG